MKASQRAAGWPLALVLAISASVTASCGGSPALDTAATASVEVGATRDEPADTRDEEWSSVVAFNEALASGDWDLASDATAPGSAANAYVDYRRQVARAQQSVGVEPAEPVSVIADDSNGTVTVVLNDDAEYVWSEFDVGGSLVTDWSTERGRMSELIAMPTAEAEVGGTTVAVPSAYATGEGDLYVVVQITSATTILVDDAVTLVSPDGGTIESANRLGVDEVPANADAVILYTFENQPLGGTVVYELQNDIDPPVAVRLPIS